MRSPVQFLSLLCLATLPAVCALGAATDYHYTWKRRLGLETGKLRLTAATYFGGSAIEEFRGAVTTGSGGIGAFGSSWGPPFPEPVKPVVVGDDTPWKVPLRIPGMEKDRDGRLLPPPEKNPNRTGFIVFYSPDLLRVSTIFRFGWGTASIDGALVGSDGSVVVTGAGTTKLRDLAKGVAVSKRLAAKSGAKYGTVIYEGVESPGDVYVAKLKPDMSGLAWIWILEGHRKPPEGIYRDQRGWIYVDCLGIKAVSPDGATLKEIKCGGATGGLTKTRLMGVSPRDGSLLVAGSRTVTGGGGVWYAPVVDFYSPGGRLLAKLYDWSGEIAGHRKFRATAKSGIEFASFFPDGRLMLGAMSTAPNSVLARNPVNILKHPSGRGLELPWNSVELARRARYHHPSVAHLVELDPKQYSRSSHTLWVPYKGQIPGRLTLHGVQALKGGRMVAWGVSGAWLLQTTQDWYRPGDHYLQNYDHQMKPRDVQKRANGWPAYMGLGGKGPFATVFAGDFKSVLWSSAMAGCYGAGAAAGTKGVAIVGRCMATVDREGRDPRFLIDDFASWKKFIDRLRLRAGSKTPSPERQVWKLLSPGLQKTIAGLSPSDKLLTSSHDRMKTQVRTDLNAILERQDFYVKGAWNTEAFDKVGKGLLARLETGGLKGRDLLNLNRRLLEQAFPDSIFRCPKSNRPAVVKAVQPKFGGGYCDGYVYLME